MLERMTFGSRLRTERERVGLTQAQLGKGLGTNEKDAGKSVVMGWEKGHHYPRADQLAMICDKLKCSADYLLAGTLSESTLSKEARDFAIAFDALSWEQKNYVRSLWSGVLALAQKRDADAHQQVQGKSQGNS